MLKRKYIILSVLLVASLICSQPYGIVKAGGECEGPEWKQVKSPGTASYECIPLEIPYDKAHPVLAIKVYRDPETLCASAISQHFSWDCSDTGECLEPYKGINKPAAAYSSGGNQICHEAFVKYVNSPGCWEINSGDGNTYYVPRG